MKREPQFFERLKNRNKKLKQFLLTLPLYHLAETIKNAFIKWVGLPADMKVAIESRLETLTLPSTLTTTSMKGDKY